MKKTVIAYIVNEYGYLDIHRQYFDTNIVAIETHVSMPITRCSNSHQYDFTSLLIVENTPIRRYGLNMSVLMEHYYAIRSIFEKHELYNGVRYLIDMLQALCDLPIMLHNADIDTDVDTDTDVYAEKHALRSIIDSQTYLPLVLSLLGI